MIHPERWHQIERLYHAALELEKPRRPEFLANACAGDNELFREVESLLDLETRANDFLEEPALHVAARNCTDGRGRSAESLTGRMLSHYQIVEKIGEGGMGVVYKARDTHLARYVAVKVLPPNSVRDNERRRRFVQEAKAASALNHPNIVTIHDIDSVDGVDFIAMEYITGKPLDRMIGPAGLPLKDALHYGVQVADALACAHAAGIIHRDVKPANIMVTDEGLAKLLDFGLAKLTEPLTAEGQTSTETLATRSEEGAVAGTVAYMSPEQAEGKPLDARSDIFSFGVVLYEAIAGRRPFAGDSRLSVLAAIIGNELEPLSTVRHAPPEIERVVARYLRKDRDRRFQTMLDLKVALQELKEESDSGRLSPATAIPTRRTKWMTFAITGFAVAALAGTLWFAGWRDHANVPTPTSPSPLTSFNGIENKPAFSPDGKQVAFVWNGDTGDNQDIYVMLVTGSPPLRLTADPAPDVDPVWSPDGNRIAFLRDGAVRVVSPLGGPETKVTDAACRGLDWSPDGKWLAVPRTDSPDDPCGTFLVSLATRERRRVVAANPSAQGDCQPAFSPDGRTLAFVRQGLVTAHEIWTVPTAGGPPRKLIGEDSDVQNIAWLPGGREIIYSSDVGGFWNLWRIPAEGGKPHAVPNTADGRSFAVSNTTPTRLVFSRDNRNIDIWRMAVPDGVPEKIIAATRADWSPQYSPDGSRLVFLSDRGGTPQLWLAESDGTRQQSLLTDPFAGTARWSPDGTRIAFDTRRRIAIVSAEGGEPRILTESSANAVRPAWSRDGRWIYFRSKPLGSVQIWKMPADGGTPTQITQNGGWEANEAPDGKLLYYVKDRTQAGLWSVPVTGGDAQLVAANVRVSWWTLAGDDLYFVNFSVKPPVIQQMNLKTRAIRTLRSVANLWPDFSPSLTGTPDGRWLAWSLEEFLGSDLMLIDNFQ